MRYSSIVAPMRAATLGLVLATSHWSLSWAQTDGTTLFQSFETEAQTLDGRNSLSADQQLALIRDDPATVSVTVGTIDTAALLSSDRLVLDLPGEDAADIDLGDVSSEPAYENAFTLQAVDDTGVKTSFVVDGEDVVGVIRTADVTYQIVPLGEGRHALVETDFGDIDDHPPGFEEEELPTGTLPPEFDEMDAGDLEDTGQTINVIVAYTNQARIAAGNITALIALAEQETNDSFANSGVNPRIRVVQSYQTTYTESGNLATDRDRFRIQGDGFMDEIHARRNTARADLAMLLTGTGSGCGIAAAILADPDTGFAVTKQSCATGNFSFGHELGHLFGARHNPEQDDSTAPFAYGHAFCNDPGNWRTIMSYNTDSKCPSRIQWWSNPSVQVSGTATGDAARRDNARVLNGTAAYIANFRVSAGTPCRSGFMAAGSRLCITTDAVGARTFANAHVYCMDRRARVASYTDLRYLYTRTILDAAFNPNGRWLGDWTGDDQVLCGNKSITADGDSDTANFDGTCNRFDSRGFWCAYDR